MFCMNKKRSVIHKGTAAVLITSLMVGSLAYGGGAVFAVDTVGGEEPTTEATSTSYATGIDEGTSENATEAGAMVLFAQDEGDGATTSTETEPTSESAEAEEAESAAEIPNASATNPVTSTYVAKNKTVGFGNSGKIKYENYHTKYYYVKNGNEKLRAYCIEPTEIWQRKKSYTAKPYNSQLMKKVLYYSVGYPGYSALTKDYLADVSKKACYNGDKGAYCLCHILLSYVYDNKASDSDAFKGVSANTKKVVKNFLASIEKWPDPPSAADIGLSASSIKAGWNEKTMRQETPKISVTGTPGNTISVPVPEGTTITREAAPGDGESTTASDDTDGSRDVVANAGNVTVKVGESFSISAPTTVQKDYKSPSIYGSMEVFQPYIIKTSGSQGQTFAIKAKNAVSYSVEWQDFGSIILKKISSDESITGENNYYSLEGAEYGLYSKATDTLYGELVTNAEGDATIENIPYGEFYIKETKASQGYQLDPVSHDIAVCAPIQSETVFEEPSIPALETIAEVGDTGEKSFYVKDKTPGLDETIVDTVKYENLTPGLTYRIDAKLVDKATGQNVPCQVAKTVFTPEEASGSLQVKFGIDSSSLGGKSAVAFERLYQEDRETKETNLIAIHEDINNKAQTVDILQPIDKTPETGDNINLLILLVIMIITGALGTLVVIRRCR